MKQPCDTQGIDFILRKLKRHQSSLQRWLFFFFLEKTAMAFNLKFHAAFQNGDNPKKENFHLFRGFYC